MIGLENIKNKKLRIFKLDHRSKLKNLIYFPGITAKAILVMGDWLERAFLISLHGSRETAATIKATRNDYLNMAPHALLKNELFVFGGETYSRKIAKLVGCEWKQQATRLINNIYYLSAAISVDNGNKALLCFPQNTVYKNCEVFDSKTSESTNGTNYKHEGGKLGLYRGNPTTVGSTFGDGVNKVETLSSSGWRVLNDFPTTQIFFHVLMGLPSGSLLLAGGWDEVWERQTAIWLLENDIWEKIGDLENVVSVASAIMIKNSIFIVPGYGSIYTIERLDFEGDKLVNQQVIGNTVMSYIPVLLEVPIGYCV